MNPEQVERIPVDSPEAAQDVLDDYDNVQQFRYADGVLEVVLDG